MTFCLFPEEGWGEAKISPSEGRADAELGSPQWQARKPGGGWRTTGTSGSRSSSPDNCHLLVHPCRNPPFPTITARVREGHRYHLSNLSGSTVTSVQVSGKNIFNKLDLNQPFPLVNHNKQLFGKSRHFLLWKNKSLILQDSNLL